MNRKGEVNCKLCGVPEDADHLMFTWPLAMFMWAFLSETLGWDGYPRSVNELLAEWLPRKFGTKYKMGLTCFAGFAWALWNMRNKLCFLRVFCLIGLLILASFFFVQKWKILMRPGDKLKIEALAGRVLEAAKVFRSSGNAVSDVGFV
jgi:hypothetical protein